MLPLNVFPYFTRAIEEGIFLRYTGVEKTLSICNLLRAYFKFNR